MAVQPLLTHSIHDRGSATPVIMDPALRLLAFLILIVTPLFLHTLAPLLMASGYLALLLLLARPHLRLLLPAARLVLLLVALVLILNMVFAGYGGGSSGLVRGVSRGIIYSLRIVIMYGAALYFVASTTQEEIARGVAGLVAPLSRAAGRKLALYGFITCGFFPVFYRELQRIRMVQRFRGGGFSGGIIRRAGDALALLIPLLVSALRRSAQLSMAVELRGVQRSIGILLPGTRPRSADYLWLAITAAVMITLALFS